MEIILSLFLPYLVRDILLGSKPGISYYTASILKAMYVIIQYQTWGQVSLKDLKSETDL